jgi:RNA polymerase sigma factor for flagellar operon FliA
MSPKQKKQQKEKPENNAGHLRSAALKAYSNQQNEETINTRIEEFLPLVPKIVNKTISYLKPPLTFEDLVSAGTLGLVKAAKNYDESHNADFKTYAYIRVRGAVLDELRKWSFVPADHSKKINKLDETIQDLTNRNGYSPSDEQIANQMQITTDELYEIMNKSRARNFLSLDDSSQGSSEFGSIFANNNASQPYQNLEKQEAVEKLSEAITRLPENHRRVIVLYYQQELTMKEIAEVLSITEPRVSQLHSSAVFRLSVKLKEKENA